MAQAPTQDQGPSPGPDLPTRTQTRTLSLTYCLISHSSIFPAPLSLLYSLSLFTVCRSSSFSGETAALFSSPARPPPASHSQPLSVSTCTCFSLSLTILSTLSFLSHSPPPTFLHRQRPAVACATTAATISLSSSPSHIALGSHSLLASRRRHRPLYLSSLRSRMPLVALFLADADSTSDNCLRSLSWPTTITANRLPSMPKTTNRSTSTTTAYSCCP